MSDRLDFSVPGTGKNRSNAGSGKLIYVFLIILLIISLSNTYVLFKGRTGVNQNNSSLIPPDKELRELALKLEKQDLKKQAVEAWKEYLSAASPDSDETARIWYRIGNIFQSKGDYDEALNAFYRSESFSTPDDIKSEISRKIQECLESAGRFAALRYELGNRVGGNMKTGGDENALSDRGEEVVAEIGTYKITRSDLDKKIENLIDSRIRGVSRYLSEEQVNREKENLLKQYSSEKGRRLFLEQFIIEELLYREALGTGLPEETSVKDSLRDMERSLLASRLLEKKYTDEIRMTARDVKDYYEANKDRYIKKDEDGKENQIEFDEIKDRVAFDLMSEKEKDIQNRLFSQLKEKYDVVIHNSLFQAEDHSEVK